MTEDHEIIVQGNDGSILTYHAYVDEQDPAGQTGWFLVIEGGSHAVAPQWVTPEEVVGDLDSMEEKTTRESVQALTEGMIDTLEQRAAALEAEGRDGAPVRNRAVRLRAELEQALTEPETT